MRSISDVWNSRSARHFIRQIFTAVRYFCIRTCARRPKGVLSTDGVTIPRRNGTICFSGAQALFRVLGASFLPILFWQDRKEWACGANPRDGRAVVDAEKTGLRSKSAQRADRVVRPYRAHTMPGFRSDRGPSHAGRPSVRIIFPPEAADRPARRPWPPSLPYAFG